MAFETLKLNGSSYQRAEILELAHQVLRSGNAADHEIALYEFLIQWFNAEPYIQVSTSGSTGAPKKIKLAKEQMKNSAAMTLSYLGLKAGDMALLALSANYIAGKMMVVRSIVGQLDLISIAPSNNPLTDVADSTHIHFAAFVPMQMQHIVDDHSTLDKARQIDHIILGGSAVTNDLQEILIDFPNVVHETFGMTETISHIAMRKLSRGTAQASFETTDDSIILGQDDRDCLVVIAPGIANGPVVSNDVVELQDERHFKWLGRVDNVVNSGGIKLFPELLEPNLSGVLPYGYFMAGIPDSELGQKLVLIVEHPDVESDELIAEIKRYFKSRYEVPKQVFGIKKFEQTPNGKLNRNGTLSKLGLI